MALDNNLSTLIQPERAVQKSMNIMEGGSPSQLTWTVLILILFGILIKIFQIVRQAYKSPLASIPNASPWAPFSRFFWAFPQEYSGDITLELPKLHEQLGPLIRIGPREVSFYSIDIYNAVHKVGSRFVKDPRTYGEFVQGGHPALFSITNQEEHSQRRRVMGRIFNRSKMDSLRVTMKDEVDKFVQALRGKVNVPVETVAACRALEADIISRFSFGATIGAISAWSRGCTVDMVAMNDEKAKWMPILVSFPALVSTLERVENIIFKITGWQSNYTAAMRDWESWAAAGLQHSLSTESYQLSKPNLIQTLLDSNVHPQTALAEARENIGPGTDTTSATLAHILWALSFNLQYQDELRAELEKVAFPTDMNSLEAVPKLNAAVKEGIRWTGAAAAMLPRIVPKEGAMFNGHFLPGGTTLTSSPIWYLRDSRAFQNPTQYDPYRWLCVNGGTISEDTDLRDKYYIPFSKGANICMGASLAYYELYLSVSQILKWFLIRPATREASSSVLEHDGSRYPPRRFKPVQLPSRKEWVAAVPMEGLDVVLETL